MKKTFREPEGHSWTTEVRRWPIALLVAGALFLCTGTKWWTWGWQDARELTAEQALTALQQARNEEEVARALSMVLVHAHRLTHEIRIHRNDDGRAGSHSRAALGKLRQEIERDE